MHFICFWYMINNQNATHISFMNFISYFKNHLQTILSHASYFVTIVIGFNSIIKILKHFIKVCKTEMLRMLLLKQKMN